jgi:hypothetical protein
LSVRADCAILTTVMNPDLERLRQILGYLAGLERRLQSQVAVPRQEMERAASEVEELKDIAGRMGSGPWDIFYRKYDSLLHEHLTAAGLRAKPPPRGWNFDEARSEVEAHFKRTVQASRGASTDDARHIGIVEAAEGLSRVVQKLAALGEQQDQLETQALNCLKSRDTDTAIGLLKDALKLFERRRAYVADEQQQIFFAKEGQNLYERLIETCMASGHNVEALEVVEQMKARALLSILGLAPLRRPFEGAPEAARESALLAEARATTHEIWRSALDRKGERGFASWARAVAVRQQLEELWDACKERPAWSEYVSVRRGDSPSVEELRTCLA